MFCYIISNFSVLYYPDDSLMSTNSFQKFNKTNSKIDRAHCSISIRIMKSPTSQRFQHSLHNKPAKVVNNLKSFQTVFKQNFNNQFVNDSLTFKSYDECSRFVQCEAFSAASTKAENRAATSSKISLMKA